MKKIKEEIYCDDCGCLIKSPSDVIHFIKFDLCWTCMVDRVNHSLSIVPLNRKCTNCNGTGQDYEYYGHNEKSYTKCSECNGTKVKKLL